MHSSYALSRTVILGTKRARVACTAHGTPPSDTNFVSSSEACTCMPFDRSVAKCDDSTDAFMSPSQGPPGHWRSGTTTIPGIDISMAHSTVQEANECLCGTRSWNGSRMDRIGFAVWTRKDGGRSRRGNCEGRSQWHQSTAVTHGVLIVVGVYHTVSREGLPRPGLKLFG